MNQRDKSLQEKKINHTKESKNIKNRFDQKDSTCYCCGYTGHIAPYFPKRKSTHKYQRHVNISMHNMQGAGDDTITDTVNTDGTSKIKSTSRRIEGGEGNYNNSHGFHINEF